MVPLPCSRPENVAESQLHFAAEEFCYIRLPAIAWIVN